jgi:hypothetical protein
MLSETHGLTSNILPILEAAQRPHNPRGADFEPKPRLRQKPTRTPNARRLDAQRRVGVDAVVRQPPD